MNWPLTISIISLGISLFVALTNYYRSLARLKVMQMNNASGSFFIKSYDGVNASVKEITLSPKMEHLVLVEVIITNQSSLPISILEFRIKNANPFNSESDTINTFAFTSKTGSPSQLGSPDRPLKYMQPVFTIDSYTSIEGYLSFWLNNESDFNIGKHKLTIETSRKKFNKTIHIKKELESCKTYDKPDFIPYKGKDVNNI